MEDFTIRAKSVHAALRAWHKAGGTAENSLSNLLLVREKLAGLARESTPVRARLATNEVLLEAIEDLAVHDERAARVLRLRFPNDETLLMVGYKLNVSEDTVSRDQRAAIESLTDILIAQEKALRWKKTLEIESHLPPASYTQLFGFEEALEDLAKRLLTPESPWVIAIVGIGGIGKTALTDALVRRIIGHVYFEDVIWLRVSPQPMSGDSESPKVAFETLIAELAGQLGLAESDPAEEQLRQVRSRLKEAPYLVVIDNIESDAETAYLVEHLNDLAQPGKFLLTSRPRLSEGAAVYQYSMSELGQQESLALLRHQAQELGLDIVARANDQQLESVFQVTGGNPLALKLVVSLLDMLPLSDLLEGLARSRPGPIEDMYRYIYWQSWQTLSENGRRLLQAMPILAKAGGRPDYLTVISGLDEGDLWPALQELRVRSLVEVQGTLEEKRYGLHRLTETFLRTEIIDWPEEDDLIDDDDART